MMLGNACVSIVKIDTLFMVLSVTYSLELRETILVYCTNCNIEVLYISVPKHFRIYWGVISYEKLIFWKQIR